MGGRKRIYDNLDALARKESVKRWLDGLTEGDSRRHARLCGTVDLFTRLDNRHP